MFKLILNVIQTVLNIFRNKQEFKVSIPVEQRPIEKQFTKDPITIKKDFLTKNKWSRPGLLRDGVLFLEIHYIANVGSSAKQNRDYFEKRKGGKLSFGSTQFLVDLDGDKYQTIPEREIAYSSGAKIKQYKKGIVKKYGRVPYRNSISIEMTHPDNTAKPTVKTYKSTIELLVHLCKKYKLTENDILRHYDITGKMCHKYYVKTQKAWIQLKNDVKKGLK